MKNEKESSSLKQVALPAQGQCPTCYGYKTIIYHENLARAVTCPTCKGTGRASTTGGAPDSRSETLSPREWPTLMAELRRAIQHLENALIAEDDNWIGIWDAEITLLREELAAERSRRPRGESVAICREEGHTNEK